MSPAFIVVKMKFTETCFPTDLESQSMAIATLLKHREHVYETM